MGQNSTIEWTDHTFNPWWGCVRVSDGCKHCYAEALAKRYGLQIWGVETERRFMSDGHWKQPHKWNKEAQRRGQRARVFCASMADVFEDNDALTAERSKLWELIEQTQSLDWLLLTKRPENMRRLAPWDRWPPNVWAMTTTENQRAVDKRLPYLVDIQASVRGLSVEPLLGEIDLTHWLGQIDWVIVGGESGAGARPMNPQWVRSLRDQCLDAGVAFFFKQWGNWSPDADGTMQKASKKKAGRQLDGGYWDQLPEIEVSAEYVGGVRNG